MQTSDHIPYRIRPAQRKNVFVKFLVNSPHQKSQLLAAFLCSKSPLANCFYPSPLWKDKILRSFLLHESRYWPHGRVGGPALTNGLICKQQPPGTAARFTVRARAEPVGFRQGLALPPHPLSAAFRPLEVSHDPFLYSHFLTHRSCSALFVLVTGCPVLGAVYSFSDWKWPLFSSTIFFSLCNLPFAMAAVWLAYLLINKRPEL